MSIREAKAELRALADDANGAARVLWNRAVGLGGDIPVIAAAFVARGQRIPGGSAGLDERVGFRAAMAAMWQAHGGATFVLSDSVAASIALTKTPGGAVRLCLPAFAIEVPRGYMPSVESGSFPGLLLVSRGPGRLVLVDCYTDRGENSGYRMVMLSEDANEDVAGAMLDDVGSPTGQRMPQWYTRAIVRLVRGTMMWVETFPPSDSQGKTVARGGFGVSVDDGRGYVFLKTRVPLDVGLRNGAQAISRGGSFERAKLALRHIVRGHWKRQVMGAERLERKLVYVEPYWRGPDAAAAFGRLYKMDTP